MLALDPSKGRDARAGDYSAFALLALDRDGVLWLDLDVARRPTPAIVERGIELYRQWQPQAFCVETNAYQELLGVEFLRVARERKLVLPMYGINNLVAKTTRLRRLGPYFAQRRLRVRATPGGKQFVQEARDFPLGAHDDALDAVEMGIRMMDYLLGRRDLENQPQVLRAA